MLLLAIAGLRAQATGDKVQVNYNGTWYDATILKTDEAKGQYFIKYDGWDDTWNEWVGPDRIKGGTAAKAPLSKFKVGDHVEVEYGMIPEPATVVEVGENKYHIKYDNSLYGDKWVTEKQIKKLWSTPQQKKPALPAFFVFSI